MLSSGRPLTCSTRTPAAPRMPPSAPAIRLAAGSMVSKSSPKTFTATSPRTPAMSSLKRMAMGCVYS